MTSTKSLCTTLVLAFTLAACGDDDGGGAIDAAVNPPDAGPRIETLLSSTWTIPPGSEIYICERKTFTEDTYVHAFYPIEPPGTHHNVVSLENSGVPDGQSPCDVNTNGPTLVYADGLGTTGIVMPEGVAIKIPAGQQLLFNLHLFNTDDAELTGTSVLNGEIMDAADVVHEAQILLAGKATGLVVPTGVSTQTGRCTMTQETTVFAVLPHMHQLGTHMTATGMPASGPVVMLDADYSFDDQTYHPLATPVVFQAGEYMDIACTYNNTTGVEQVFGESSNDEMCFTATYLYPRRNGNYVCED